MFRCWNNSKTPGQQRNFVFRQVTFRQVDNLHEHSRITGPQGKEEGISLTSHYHLHPLHRHLDISRMITAESSPLHIDSSRTRTGNLWFLSAIRYPLSYTPLLYIIVPFYHFTPLKFDLSFSLKVIENASKMLQRFIFQ